MRNHFNEVNRTTSAIFTVVNYRTVCRRVSILFFVFNDYLLRGVFCASCFAIRLCANGSLFRIRFRLLRRYATFAKRREDRGHMFHSFEGKGRAICGVFGTVFFRRLPTGKKVDLPRTYVRRSRVLVCFNKDARNKAEVTTIRFLLCNSDK